MLNSGQLPKNLSVKCERSPVFGVVRGCLNIQISKIAIDPYEDDDDCSAERKSIYLDSVLDYYMRELRL